MRRRGNSTYREEMERRDEGTEEKGGDEVRVKRYGEVIRDCEGERGRRALIGEWVNEHPSFLWPENDLYTTTSHSHYIPTAPTLNTQMHTPRARTHTLPAVGNVLQIATH